MTDTEILNIIINKRVNIAGISVLDIVDVYNILYCESSALELTKEEFEAIKNRIERTTISD